MSKGTQTASTCVPALMSAKTIASHPFPPSAACCVGLGRGGVVGSSAFPSHRRKGLHQAQVSLVAHPPHPFRVHVCICVCTHSFTLAGGISSQRHTSLRPWRPCTRTRWTQTLPYVVQELGTTGLLTDASVLCLQILNEVGLDPGLDHMSAMQVRT